jgi:hypothetical protein
MDVILLFVLFAFLSFSIWLGYLGYRALLKKDERHR